jgi:Cu+-exporting ATPase
VLRLAAALERRSEHPLAEGIVRAATKQGVPLEEPEGFEVYPGAGVAGTVGGRRVWCGTEKLMGRAVHHGAD